MINLFGWLKRSKMKREIIINVEKLETRVSVTSNGTTTISKGSLSTTRGAFDE